MPFAGGRAAYRGSLFSYLERISRRPGECPVLRVQMNGTAETEERRRGDRRVGGRGVKCFYLEAREEKLLPRETTDNPDGDRRLGFPFPPVIRRGNDPRRLKSTLEATGGGLPYLG